MSRPTSPAPPIRPARRLPLLSRMAADLDDNGSLRTGTAAAMYVAYAAHAALTAEALRRRSWAMPLPPPVARGTGLLSAGAGTALCILGMSRFTGAGEVSGTQEQELVTGGVYRWSRNPQYLGYVVALGGLALARRSAGALAAAAAAGVAYATWVPVEERHLARRLGEPYHAYRRATRRWWGRA